ncbi:hypothetical protein BCR35DRAFT_306177 [Leucosporidium creatinivorum]|uniref:Uncharacterized protein n=1 Tax=Leucosporidium creatinivorum TaxID=106004 RepID=A0A1Y2EX04_9BASI|nr:hypothetical protein BCR35DRAFT_306177 [Leucosporidium creatinivorum]
MPSPQPYLLPSPQPSYRSPPTSHYSPSSFTPSFFGMTSPSMSSSHGSTGSQMFTPNPGSAYSASSGYFSHPEGPYSPSNNFSSPSGTFLRLSLDSPHTGSAYSPRSNAGSFEQSPLPPSDPPIHLPPIVSPRIWNGPQSFNDRDQRDREYEVQRARQRDMERGHQRSQSEGTAADAMRLPPMRGSADPPRPSSSSSRPPPSVSLPTSPEDPQSAPLHPSPSRPSSSHPSSSPHSTRSAQQQQRRKTLPHPSSLAHTSAHGNEPEGEMGPPSGPAGVGLGMLAMAGEMVEDDETEKEREARERYTATRKLSYNALREQASSSAEGGAGKDAEMGGM